IRRREILGVGILHAGIVGCCTRPGTIQYPKRRIAGWIPAWPQEIAPPADEERRTQHRRQPPYAQPHRPSRLWEIGQRVSYKAHGIDGIEILQRIVLVALG